MSLKSSSGVGDVSDSKGSPERPGKMLGSEHLPGDVHLDPELAASKAFKRAQGVYGPDAHEVSWNPGSLTAYSELNDPFFFRTPKSLADPPAHVPQNPITLSLHMRDERQRLAGMTNSEREWRKKYLEAQNLHPDEPFFVESAQLPLNPIRRIYRMPMNFVQQRFLIPTFGLKRANRIRHFAFKWCSVFLGIEFCYYHLKYNQEVWWDSRRVMATGWRPSPSRRAEIEAKYPDMIDIAYATKKHADDFIDLGFKSRKVCLNVGDTVRPW